MTITTYQHIKPAVWDEQPQPDFVHVEFTVFNKSHQLPPETVRPRDIAREIVDYAFPAGLPSGIEYRAIGTSGLDPRFAGIRLYLDIDHKVGRIVHVGKGSGNHLFNVAALRSKAAELVPIAADAARVAEVAAQIRQDNYQRVERNLAAVATLADRLIIGTSHNLGFAEAQGYAITLHSLTEAQVETIWACYLAVRGATP